MSTDSPVRRPSAPVARRRVLIVDDSALVRRVLSRELEQFPWIDVIGAAPDPFVARDMIISLKPDVITLDIEMPRMDGLSFLRRLMRYHPVPTIIVSSLTPRGCEMTLACLEAGAVDVLNKPSGSYSVGDLASELSEIIRGAPRIITRRTRTPEQEAANARARVTSALPETTNKIIAIGASTGGTEAIREVLQGLPAMTPGIVIVQHMPAGFTKSFADRLNTICPMNVHEAKDGDSVIPGEALLAPGGRHMRLARDGARYIVRLSDDEPVRRHRPSVDVLFHSVAEHAGPNAVAALLTGMGDDGADGLVHMRQAGARTVAQDEATCVVFGMPKEGILRGGAEATAPLDDVATQLMDFLAQKKPSRAA